jgi:hypothetical protein
MTGISAVSGGKPNAKHMDRSFPPPNWLRRRADHPLAASHATDVSKFVAQGYASWSGMRQGGSVETAQEPAGRAREDAGAAAIRHVETSSCNLAERFSAAAACTAGAPPTTRSSSYAKRQFPLVGAAAGCRSRGHLDDAANAKVQAVEQSAAVCTTSSTTSRPPSQWLWLPYLAECARTEESDAVVHHHETSPATCQAPGRAGDEIR